MDLRARILTLDRGNSERVVENADEVFFVVVSSVSETNPILEIKLSDLGERDKCYKNK
jgi:hypothetical protein